MTTLTRQQAILHSRERQSEGIITYITGISPVLEKHLTSFLTKGSKTHNTETFIIMNRVVLLEAYYKKNHLPSVFLLKKNQPQKPEKVKAETVKPFLINNIIPKKKDIQIPSKPILIMPAATTGNNKNGDDDDDDNDDDDLLKHYNLKKKRFTDALLKMLKLLK